MKLRAFQISDRETLSKWIGNPEMQKALNVSKVDSKKPYMFYMIEMDDGSSVGAVSLFNIEWFEKAEIGIVFIRKAFHKSIIKELINFIDLAFKVYSLKYIYGIHNGEKAEKFAAYFEFKNGKLTKDDFYRRWF